MEEDLKDLIKYLEKQAECDKNEESNWDSIPKHMETWLNGRAAGFELAATFIKTILNKKECPF